MFRFTQFAFCLERVCEWKMNVSKIASRQMQVARIIQAVVNSVPANADVHVEINQNPRNFGQQPHIEIQHVPSQQQAAGTGISNTGSPTEQGKFSF